MNLDARGQAQQSGMVGSWAGARRHLSVQPSTAAQSVPTRGTPSRLDGISHRYRSTQTDEVPFQMGPRTLEDAPATANDEEGQTIPGSAGGNAMTELQPVETTTDTARVQAELRKTG
jgi:hypothetical protein